MYTETSKSLTTATLMYSWSPAASETRSRTWGPPTCLALPPFGFWEQVLRKQLVVILFLTSWLANSCFPWLLCRRLCGGCRAEPTGMKRALSSHPECSGLHYAVPFDCSKIQQLLEQGVLRNRGLLLLVVPKVEPFGVRNEDT